MCNLAFVKITVPLIDFILKQILHVLIPNAFNRVPQNNFSKRKSVAEVWHYR